MGIYTHFGDKQRLVEAIFLDGLASFDAAVGAHLSDGLRPGAWAYREWALTNSMHYMVIFGRAVPSFEPSVEALERGRQSFDGLVDAVRRSGAADPTAAAYHLWATIHGHVMFELAGLRVATSERAAELYGRALDQILAGLGTY